MAGLSLLLIAVWADGSAVGRDTAVPPGRVKSGSGFFVSPDGELVTSAHVIAGCPSISIWGSDGAQRAGSIVATDAISDIALVRAPGAVTDYASAPGLAAPPIGTAVFALGYGVLVRNPRKPVTADGTYLGTDTSPSGVRVFVMGARLREGQSGGPVIGADGALLGMVIGRYTERPGRGVVLPASKIEAFLASNGLRLLPRPADHDRRSRNLLAAITALVQCLPSGEGDGGR